MCFRVVSRRVGRICPKCGGNVLLMDDYDGVLLQCLQCSRSWPACPIAGCEGILVVRRCSQCDYGSQEADGLFDVLPESVAI